MSTRPRTLAISRVRMTPARLFAMSFSSSVAEIDVVQSAAIL